MRKVTLVTGDVVGEDSLAMYLPTYAGLSHSNPNLLGRILQFVTDGTPLFAEDERNKMGQLNLIIFERGGEIVMHHDAIAIAIACIQDNGSVVTNPVSPGDDMHQLAEQILARYQ